jgi:hypothetical protein
MRVDGARERIGEYLEVEHVELPERKTDRWFVYSTRGGALGRVEWFGRWRQYAFKPGLATSFNAACLTDLASFLERINREHRERRTAHEP